MEIGGRILSFIVTTFLVALVYGSFCATEDFFNASGDPVGSGRRAAGNIYNLFGVVTEEASRADANAAPPDAGKSGGSLIARKIAAPYAATADVAAIISGKAEHSLSSFFHTVNDKAQANNKG